MGGFLLLVAYWAKLDDICTWNGYPSGVFNEDRSAYVQIPQRWIPHKLKLKSQTESLLIPKKYGDR